jgi:hypothetical protein
LFGKTGTIRACGRIIVPKLGGCKTTSAAQPTGSLARKMVA